MQRSDRVGAPQRSHMEWGDARNPDADDEAAEEDDG